MASFFDRLDDGPSSFVFGLCARYLCWNELHDTERFANNKEHYQDIQKRTKNKEEHGCERVDSLTDPHVAARNKQLKTQNATDNDPAVTIADDTDGNPDDAESLDKQESKSAEESGEAIAIRRRRGGVLDGIKLEDPQSYLKRERLVQKAISVARQTGILVVSSPPGSAKMSLIQLIIQSLHRNEENNLRGVIACPSQPSNPEFDLFDYYVRDEIGVCYEENTLSDKLQSYSEVWLLLDDAHRLYPQKFH